MKTLIYMVLALTSLQTIAKDKKLEKSTVTITAKACAQNKIKGFSFISVTARSADDIPVPTTDLWLTPIDNSGVSHFSSTAEGKIESYIKENRYELYIKAPSEVGSETIRNINYTFSQDSCYTILINFKSLFLLNPSTYPQVKPVVVPITRELEKPVIYLYSESELDFKMNLKLKGEKKFVYPLDKSSLKNEITWQGTIKNGKDIVVNGNTYPYLFWDAQMPLKQDYSKGFCTAGKNTVEFLEEKLTEIGLNQTEMTDFITYWAPRMEQNNYNKIHFYLDPQYEEEIASMDISPKPEAMLRVFMTFSSSNYKVKVQEQKFTSFKRKGFTLVEWGGSELTKVK